MWRQRNVADSPSAGLNHHLMIVEIDRGHKVPSTVWSRQGCSFPSPSSQPECGVLELWFRWCECDRELAEELCVGMQGVAGLMPLLIGKRGPPRRHSVTLTASVTGVLQARERKSSGISKFNPRARHQGFGLPCFAIYDDRRLG